MPSLGAFSPSGTVTSIAVRNQNIPEYLGWARPCGGVRPSPLPPAQQGRGGEGSSSESVSESKAPPTAPFPCFVTNFRRFPVLQAPVKQSGLREPSLLGPAPPQPGCCSPITAVPRALLRDSGCWAARVQGCRCCPGAFAPQGLGLRAKGSAEGSEGSTGRGRGQRQGELWNSPEGDIHSLTETPGMSETRPWGRDNSTITAKLESRPWLACSAGEKSRKNNKIPPQAPAPACWTQPWRAGPWQDPGARGRAYNWMGLVALRVLLWGP